MKILLVAHQLPPRHAAGTEVYTERLATALAREHEVVVFAADDDPSRRPGIVTRRKGAGFQILELAVSRVAREPEDSWHSPTAETAFAKVLDQVAPDIVHFQHLRYLGFDLPGLARLRGIPTLLTLHDYWLICTRDGQLVDRDGKICPGPEAGRCARCLVGYRFGLSSGEARALRLLDGVRRRFGIDLSKIARRAGLSRRSRRNPRAEKGLATVSGADMLALVSARWAALQRMQETIDLFIAPSKFLRSVFRDAGVSDEKLVVVSHGIDDGVLARRVEQSGGNRPLRVVFFGTVTPLKGVDLLVDAVQELRAGTVEVDVYGRDDQRPEYVRPLRARARGLPVRFHGAFTPESAGEKFRDADVAVVPSRWVENQPLAILEAFANRVPVVAASLGGMKELVLDGVNGRLFTAGDADDLARVLSELAADRPQLEMLARGIVPQKSMSDHATEIVALYRRAGAIARTT